MFHVPLLRFRRYLSLHAIYCGIVLSLLVNIALPSHAWCCNDDFPQVHQSGQLTWCADPTFWQAHSDQITPFFEYADRLVPQLAKDFGLATTQQYYIVVKVPDGSASTPTIFGPGINVSGDAFYNTSYNIKGYYGYIFVTHEFINQWTGTSNNGGGWPTDWWANHRSPFPNAMDSVVLKELGREDIANVQAGRFAPGGDSEDPQVPMFANIFDNYGGWTMFQKFFAMLRQDNLTWTQLRDPPDFQKSTQFVSGNPSARLANFVVAYMNVAAKSDLQSQFTAGGIGTKPPNWSNTDPTFQTYSLDANVIEQIGNAHCLLAGADLSTEAGKKAVSAMKYGDYNTVLTALQDQQTCTKDCNDVCVCVQASKTCAPTYLHPNEQINPNPDAPDSPVQQGNSIAGGYPSTQITNGGCSCSQTPFANQQIWTWVGILACLFYGRRSWRKL